MKSFGILSFFLALIMIVTPLISIGSSSKTKSTNSSSLSSLKDNKEDKNSELSEKKNSKYNDFKVLLKDGKVLKLSELEYICGTVACEMPPTFHNEALKAQAIACYTYACKAREEQRKNPSPDLKGADLSSNSSIHQGFKTKNELKEKWGDKFDIYYNKIQENVKTVLGQTMTYNGELIIAAYHSISSGVTESAKIVWGKDIPYLVSVNSVGDKLSPDYSSTVVYNKDQFLEAAKTIKGTNLGEDCATWITNPQVSQAGTVTSITIGGKNVSGCEIRKAFKLRSSCFNVVYANNNFTFNVLGYGHCVGLSQYGADYMARQGKSYKEILLHYYSGIKIK